MQQAQNNMSESLQKLQGLLQKLFRADAADLDFGIYRIINFRRDQLQTFIDEELPVEVNKVYLMQTLQLNRISKDLEELKKDVISSFW